MDENKIEQNIDLESDDTEEAPKKQPYFKLGLMIFLTFCACIVVFFLILRYEGFTDGFNRILMVLQPIVFGAVGAYLVNPIMKVYEKQLLKFFLPKCSNEKKARIVIRNVAITLGLITFLAIIAAIIGIIIPQMVSNISDLTKSVPKEINRLTAWLESNSDSPVIIWVSDNLRSASIAFTDWLKTDFMKEIVSYIESIANGVYTVVRSLLNLLIGIIVAVYILTSKEKFIGQGKKIIYAIFKPKTGNKIIHVMRRSNDIFGGFVIGKIIDSLIIGVIAYVGCKIMQMPYAALLATIIGVTNIIPFFGPFIGAVPCLILVVLYDPLKALYLLIFIIILQQVDGNIIGPKILGDYTGLSSFWVIFAILIGGGFFGVPGMILGVPLFAVIYYLLKRLFENKLRKKELPTETETYVRAVQVDTETNQLRYPEDMKPEEKEGHNEKPVRVSLRDRFKNWRKK